MSKVSAALRSPRDMDEFLEVHTAEEIITELKRELVANAFGNSHQEDVEVISDLVSACGGIPYLATCIYETITRAGLQIIKRRTA